MHRLTVSILDVSNAFQNTNVPIHEIVYVSPPPYYLDCFEIYYPNVPFNRDCGPFCLQFMNGVQGGKTAGRKCNRLIDAVGTILRYKNITIYHAIYIKFLYGVTVYYLKVSNYYILNTNNNDTSFPELTRVFEEHFEMKFQEGYVPKFTNFPVSSWFQC